MKPNFTVLALFLLFAFQTFGIQLVRLPKIGNSTATFTKSGSAEQNKNNKFLLVVTEESEESCEDDSESNLDSNDQYSFKLTQIFLKNYLEKSNIFPKYFYKCTSFNSPIYLIYRNIRI